MATVTITIPDAVLPRVLAAYSATYGYDAASGLTQAQFTKARVIDQMKATVRNYEGESAGTSAEATARSAVDSEISLS